MKEVYREKSIDTFSNEQCIFKPTSWIEIEGVPRPVTFKVVTEDLQSLGLRKNPNIMTFIVGEWVSLLDDELSVGKDDRGGIWSALKFSGAKTLTTYMWEKYNRRTRMFLTAIDNPLYANSYRVKSQGVFLIKEM